MRQNEPVLRKLSSTNLSALRSGTAQLLERSAAPLVVGAISLKAEAVSAAQAPAVRCEPRLVSFLQPRS